MKPSGRRDVLTSEVYTVECPTCGAIKGEICKIVRGKGKGKLASCMHIKRYLKAGLVNQDV